MSNKRSKKILIFSLAYYPHIGGAEIALKEITDRISDTAFHMITLRMADEKKEERIGAILVHRVGSGASRFQKILFIPRAAYLAAHLHRENRFDALWAMMSYMLLPIVLLRFGGVRVPYLLTLQEGDPWEYMFRRWLILPFRWMLSIGFKNASAVQVISTHLAEWACRLRYQGEISVIPNGVDVARFADVQHQVSDTTALVTTSRLVEKNAVDDVIRALSLLPDTVHFIIYGIGPDETTLRKLAHTLDVVSRIHFRGHISHADLPYALAACDIFIRPSRSEGLGNSFLEAMAAGLPVIGTREGGLKDFLFDGETGWVVEKDSPEQIAKAVQDILAHPEKVKRITENALKLVSERYEWSHIAEQMKDVFDRVLKARP